MFNYLPNGGTLFTVDNKDPHEKKKNIVNEFPLFYIRSIVLFVSVTGEHNQGYYPCKDK